MQECKLDYEPKASDLAVQKLDKLRDCASRSAGRKNVINNEDLLAGLDGVRMDLKLIGSVLQIVLDACYQGREFLRLPNRDKSGSECVCHSGREKVAACLDTNDDIDGVCEVVLLKGINGLAKTVLIF